MGAWEPIRIGYELMDTVEAQLVDELRLHGVHKLIADADGLPCTHDRLAAAREPPARLHCLSIQVRSPPRGRPVVLFAPLDRLSHLEDLTM